MKRKTLFFLLGLLFLVPLSLRAYDFKSGDLYYNITSSKAPYTVAVTYQDRNRGNYSGLTTAVIPETVTNEGITYNVTSIGDSTFYICSGLTSITIGNGVTSIENLAFYNCSGLASITIPNSVTSIGEGAFEGCTGLATITIPNNVTSIGMYAFASCASLTSVIWNATYCGDFSGSRNLFYTIQSKITSFIFGNEVEYIPAYLCYGMSQLTSVTIPNSVTSIGEGAFLGCTGFTSVAIPNSVTSIGKFAFKDCSALTSITISNSVTSIESGVFYGCTNVFSITIPNTVVSIQGSAFGNVNNIVYHGVAKGEPWGALSMNGDYHEGYFIYDSEAKTHLVKCFAAVSGELVLPESLISIGPNAFKNCTGLTAITLPESLTTIGQSAFDGCTGFAEITIPKNVTDIGLYAFYNNNLTSVVWNAKNCKPVSTRSEWLGTGTSFCGYFSREQSSMTISRDIGSELITSFTIGADVEVLPDYLCYYMPNLTSITIPSNVKRIDGAFIGCSGLTEITIPESITTIGENAFYNCTSLTSITIPNSVQVIGKKAFNSCTSLVSVNLGDSVTSMGDEIFRECEALKEITIPSSVQSIGRLAFWSCKTLSSVTIENGITTIGPIFEDCVSLTSVALPNSVTSIGEGAFRGCISLTSITIPENVIYLGNNVFSGCSGLTSITIPENVTYLGDCAFKNCTSLASITSEAIEPPATRSGDSYNSFQTLPHDIPVYVPCGGYELYLASNWGSYFSNIQAPVPPFALYAWSESEAEGSVAIDKTQQCAGVGYLTATPEDGYEFVQWSDGNTDNPRTVELTQDTSFVAEFDVIKSGKCGDDLYWTYRDGEISITGTGAMYDYTVATQPWPLLRDNITAVSICNTATYIGTYAFADCGALRTVRFEDGICAYIADYAFFDCYSLDTLVIPDYAYAAATIGAYAFKNCSGLRSVSLGTSVHSVGQQAFYGCYGLNELSIYSRCSLDDQAFAECPSLSHIYNYNAVPNTCNASVFDGLDKFGCTLHVPQGTTDKYRIASVWRDFYYMEEMVPTYTVSVETASADWGSVTGGGEYLSGTEITLRAVPATGYRFVRWNDGNTDNPRTVTVTEDATYTAVFDVLQLLVTVLPSNYSHGVVTGGGWYNYGETAVLEATPATGYWFYCWQDGSKDNPRTVTVTEDITYTATFRPYTFTVSATADDASRGEVTGSGTYGYGEIATLNAIAYTGYRFTHWSDSNTDNPRTIVLTQDISLTAYFEQIPTYAVSLSCDAEQGTVSGGGTYREGEQVTISATPNKGYEFVQWSDGNTDNPRSWIVTEDVSLSAIFQQVTALPQTTAASQETQKVVKDGQVLILRNGKAYNMLGQEVR